MVTRNLVFLLAVVLLGNCLVSCGGSGDTSNQASLVDSLGLDTSKAQPVLAVPPANKEVEARIVEQANQSPFKDLGCCADEKRRKAEPCCCDEVLEKYKQMKAAKDKNLGQLKMSDPILAVCRKKLRKQFDAVDYPPPPPGTKETVDY